VKNDSIELLDSTNEIYIKAGGKYFVEVYDLATGCATTSSSIIVDEFPSVPNFSIQVNQNLGMMYTTLTGLYTYQWQIFNGGTWYNIPSPLGTQSAYTPAQSG